MTNAYLGRCTFGPGGLRVPPVVADEAKLAIVFGPGGLRAPPVVADGREAGHCFHLLLIFFLLLTSSAFHQLWGYSKR